MLLTPEEADSFGGPPAQLGEKGEGSVAATISEAHIDRGADVLIVEDESLVRMMAAEILVEAGYRTIEACDAPTALAVLERDDGIAAIFTDIEMPGMSVLALAGIVRERWPGVAILVTSGRVRPRHGEFPEGADFIPKPYNPPDLVRAVGAMIARSVRDI